MGRYTFAAVIASAVLSVLPPEHAGASAAEMRESCDRYSCSVVPTYVADAGERNDVSVFLSSRDAKTLTIRDTGAIIRPGRRCSALGQNQVQCDATGARLYEARVSTGDLDDRVAAEGDAFVFIDGGGENDRLVGGRFNDSLKGGEGTDELDGGGGLDTVDYSDSRWGVTADLQNGLAVNARGERDTLAGLETAVGSPAKDHLIGSGNHDQLEGGSGNDRLEGRAGPDVLKGGPGSDQLDGGEGNDVFDLHQFDIRRPGVLTPDRGHDHVTCGPGRDFPKEAIHRDFISQDCEEVGTFDQLDSLIPNHPLRSLRQRVVHLEREKTFDGKTPIDCRRPHCVKMSLKVARPAPGRSAPEAGTLLGSTDLSPSDGRRALLRPSLSLSSKGRRLLRTHRHLLVKVSVRAGFGLESGGFTTELRAP